MTLKPRTVNGVNNTSFSKKIMMITSNQNANLVQEVLLVEIIKAVFRAREGLSSTPGQNLTVRNVLKTKYVL